MEWLQREFIKFNTPNKNGICYSKDGADDLILQFNSRKHPMFGEMGRDTNLELVTLMNISHKINDITSDGDSMIATIEILDTPKGRDLQMYIDMDMIEFKPNGYCEMGENGEITKLTLISVDAAIKQPIDAVDLITKMLNYELTKD